MHNLGVAHRMPLRIAFCQQITLSRRPQIATPLKKIKFIGGVIVYVSLAGTVHLFPG